MNIWKEIRAYLRLTASIADQIDKEAAEASIRRNIEFCLFDRSLHSEFPAEQHDNRFVLILR